MEKSYTQGLAIDGTLYRVPLVKVQREFNFLEKYANRTEDGDIKIETIGGYQNYTVSIGIIDDPEEYERLWEHITDAGNRFHTVYIPDSTSAFEFYGYFSSIKDEIEKVYEDSVVYKSLSFKMISKKPTRKG